MRRPLLSRLPATVLIAERDGKRCAGPTHPFMDESSARSLRHLLARQVESSEQTVDKQG